MSKPKISSENAAAIINLLRDNPGVAMTLGDISDETDIPAEELASDLTDLVTRAVLAQEVTADGFDVYRFPDEYQRGSAAPDD